MPRGACHPQGGTARPQPGRVPGYCGAPRGQARSGQGRV